MTYPIRASYRRHAELHVLGKDRTGTWLRVVTADERAGWIATEYVEMEAALGSLPVVDGMATSTGDHALAASQLSGPAGVPPESGVDADVAVPNISDAPEGMGVITVPVTNLHVAPGARTEVVQVLREEEQVKLFGQARGAWVRVQPFTSVVPGWVYAAHLLPLPGTIAGAPLITTTATLTTTASVTTTAPIVQPAPSPTHEPAMVDAIAEPEADESAVPPARVPAEIVVTVVRATTASTVRRGATPTPPVPSGVDGLRVELVTVFGDVLAEAVTPLDGRVTFNRAVSTDTAVFVQIAALGLRTPLAADTLATGHAALTISLPVTSD